MAFAAQRFASLAELPPGFEQALLVDELQNSGVIGLLSGLRARGKEPYRLFGVTKDNSPYGLALQTDPNRFLVLSWMGEKALPPLVQQVQSAIDTGVGPHGAWGSEPTAGIFAGLWSSRTGVMARLSMPQGVYRLTKLNEISLFHGEFRAARTEDLDLLAGWYSAFTRDAGLEPHERVDPSEAHLPTERLIQEQRLHVWCASVDNGPLRPVAMANLARETPGGTCLNLVYTPRELRGRGFAGAVTWHLSSQVLATGRFAFLFTDLRNPCSNALYRKLGYRFAGDHASYVFGKERPGV